MFHYLRFKHSECKTFKFALRCSVINLIQLLTGNFYTATC